MEIFLVNHFENLYLNIKPLAFLLHFLNLIFLDYFFFIYLSYIIFVTWLFIILLWSWFISFKGKFCLNNWIRFNIIFDNCHCYPLKIFSSFPSNFCHYNPLSKKFWSHYLFLYNFYINYNSHSCVKIGYFLYFVFFEIETLKLKKYSHFWKFDFLSSFTHL